MRYAAALFTLLWLAATPAAAQSRRDGRADDRQGVPAGHLPPPGQCRVWYDDLPPGQQPPPTTCRQAERLARWNGNARVIYGDRDDRAYRDRSPRRTDNDRGVSRRDRSGRYPSSEDRAAEWSGYPARPDDADDADMQVPFANGYRDGMQNGYDDVRERRSHDPRRHRHYRSAERGYEQRLGSRDEYRRAYREGFAAGYEEGYYGTADARAWGRPGTVRRPPR